MSPKKNDKTEKRGRFLALYLHIFVTYPVSTLYPKCDFVLESYKAKFNSLYLQMTFGGNVNQIVYMCRLFLLLVLTSNVRSINVQGQIKVGYFL